MARNRMTDLRNHLFETLEALKDEEKPMDVDRARAISEVAQTIIESAKIEVALVKAIGGESHSEFFGEFVAAVPLAKSAPIRERAALAAVREG